MARLDKMKILARHGPYEVGILVVGLVYLIQDGKLSTEDTPYDAVRKIHDEEARRDMMKQILGG